MENNSNTVTSFVFITQSASVSSPNSSSTNSASDSAKSTSSSSNKGAIIGGVVGGVLGFLILAVTVVFLLRRRIFSSDNSDDESILADDLAYEEALKTNQNPFASEEDKHADSNVMLGKRRLSDGSLADAADYGMKVLRVANPDDE